jgi:hypothetical protein
MPENPHPTIYIFDTLKSFCEYMNWRTPGIQYDADMIFEENMETTSINNDTDMIDVTTKRGLDNGIGTENKRMRIED